MEKTWHLPKQMESSRGLLEASSRPFIKLHVKKAETGRYDSKIAGDPYYPKHEPYPEDESGRPMKLLAQINFADMPGLPDFPDIGILQFYISVSDDVYGLNFDDGCAQTGFCVKYFEHVTEQETELMDDFSFVQAEDEYNFPIQSEALITPELSAEWVLPSDFQFRQYAGMDAFDYFEQCDDEVYDEYTANAFGHKIGGYASFTQEDPRSYSHQDHTILLLQIDSDDDIDSMWGDVGIANFFIRPEDLKKKDFSNVLYNWDCS
ncbi:YwqG family protein [Bacillus amyloliquefaciens]|uniref:YwqG family protein n=1 Tax=Bacillus amyloliquefaciens TaxID=1390 RepID=UPI002DBF6415|nr:YwqG family protein [Bacillus amyloliquefaciens]MEC3839735.1 YwqG family protein [Bacillus amyloliquefaciens]